MKHRFLPIFYSNFGKNYEKHQKHSRFGLIQIYILICILIKGCKVFLILKIIWVNFYVLENFTIIWLFQWVFKAKNGKNWFITKIYTVYWVGTENFITIEPFFKFLRTILQNLSYLAVIPLYRKHFLSCRLNITAMISSFNLVFLQNWLKTNNLTNMALWGLW